MRVVDTLVGKGTSGATVTYVLATAHSKLYIAVKKGVIPPSDLNTLDPSKWHDKPGYMAPTPVDLTSIYPEAKPTYHRFQWRQGESHNSVWKKHLSPLTLASDEQDLYAVSHDAPSARLTTREIKVAEFLRNNPHPNIAKYRGVICTNTMEFGKGTSAIRMTFNTERVWELVYKRYDGDLIDLLKTHKRFDLNYCLRSIEAGILHMHSLGLSHCDIKPENIFYTHTGSSSRPYEFVIGDFDSAAPVGSRIELKGGDWRWAPKKSIGDRIDEMDDWEAFANVKVWLVKILGGRLEEYDGIGKRVVGAHGPRLNL